MGTVVTISLALVLGVQGVFCLFLSLLLVVRCSESVPGSCVSREKNPETLE